MDLPFGDYAKKFSLDPDMTGDRGSNRLRKHIASRGESDIASKYVHGGKGRSILKLTKERMKALPKYVLRNPGRFGIGAAGVVGGGSLLRRGIQRKRSGK